MKSAISELNINANVFIWRGGGAFCWNADGCQQKGGRGQKSQKFADVLNG